jgi:20S proteasome alpha/beta subunit
MLAYRRKRWGYYPRYRKRRGTRAMTTCVAALCDERKSIILVADRMIGYGFVQSEPDIGKTLPLHKHWRVMIAGNDVDPAFEVIDAAKEKLKEGVPAPSMATVMDTVSECYIEHRRRRAEAKYISPRGVTLDAFLKEGRKWVPESDYLERLARVDQFEFDLQLIVAGFDGEGLGHIFSIDSDDDRGAPRRHDVGFYAIGSGSTNATFFMALRGVTPKMTVREVLYFALEGKYWGEEASGVGEDTDINVLRFDLDDIPIGLDTIDNSLIPICYDLRPRGLSQFSRHLKTLNELAELKDFPLIPPKKKPKTKSNEGTKES